MNRLGTLAAVSVLVLGACQAQVKNPDTLVNASYGDWFSFDPAWAYDTSSAEVIENVYERLIGYDGEATDKFVPVLASEVPTVENGGISEDGLTYRFKIREGVKFHKGGDLSAADVVYSVRRLMVMDPVGGPAALLMEPLLGVSSSRDADSELAITWEQIEAAVYEEDGAAVFKLAKPFAPFLSVLAHTSGSIVDVEWSVEQGEWDGTEATWQDFNNPSQEDSALNAASNGTGPFSLEQYTPSRQVVLARNDNYWREPAALKRVVLQNVTEYSTRRLMLQNGDSDMAAVDRQYIPEVQQTQGVKIMDDLPTLQINAIFLNQNINPSANSYIGSGKLDGQGIPPDFFADPDVRKAFAYSFDYQTYIKDVDLGKAKQPSGAIPEPLIGYDPEILHYTYDPEKAEEHFQAAWDGQVWEQGFKLSLLYNEGNTARKTALEMLERSLESLNPKFQVETRGIQWASYLQQQNDMKLPAYMLGWVADYADPHNFAHPFYFSQGNYPSQTGYNNPEMDRLINEAVVELDPEARKGLYRQIQELGYQDAPSILVNQPVGAAVMRDWVKGYYYNPMITNDYYSLSK